LIGVRKVQAYALSPGFPTATRELPSVESTLIFNVGPPISIVDASGALLHVGSGRAFFAGLHRRFCFSQCEGAQSGVQVRLSPQAAYRILGPGVAACADRAVLVEEVAGKRLSVALHRIVSSDPSSVRDALIALLHNSLLGAPQLCPEIDWAIGQLVLPGMAVSTVAAQLGWSRRRLIERCGSVLGITPKMFGRIARYRRVLADLPQDRSWADRAFDAGYCDQSHMIRDFSAFTGLTPADYVRERVTFVQ